MNAPLFERLLQKKGISFPHPDFLEAVRAWEDKMRIEKNFSPLTLRNYFQDLMAFSLFISLHKGAPLSLESFKTLEAADFRAFLAARQREGVSHRSNARAMSMLRSFNIFLGQKYDLRSNALSGLSLPRLKVSLPRPIPVERALALTQGGAGEGEIPRPSWVKARDQALFTLLYGCGLRISEALNLTIQEVHSSPRFLTIKGKGGKQRMIPLQKAVLEALSFYLSLAPHSHSFQAPLFIGLQGKRLNPGVAQKCLREWRVPLGLEDSATPHALRHSFASHLLGRGGGGDLRAIQELLGHASLATTQRYTRLETAKLLEVYTQAHPRARPLPKKEGS